MAKTRTSSAGNGGAEPAVRDKDGDAQQAGFTLVETLVVVAILAVAVSAVASFARPNGIGVNLKSATHLIAAKLREARNDAILSRRTRDVRIDVTARRIWTPHDRTALQIDRGINIAITSASTLQASRNVAAIRFFPDGGTTGATLQLQATNQTNEIRINWLTGRVTSRRLP